MTPYIGDICRLDQKTWVLWVTQASRFDSCEASSCVVGYFSFPGWNIPSVDCHDISMLEKCEPRQHLDVLWENGFDRHLVAHPASLGDWTTQIPGKCHYPGGGRDSSGYWMAHGSLGRCTHHWILAYHFRHQHSGVSVTREIGASSTATRYFLACECYTFNELQSTCITFIWWIVTIQSIVHLLFWWIHWELLRGCAPRSSRCGWGPWDHRGAMASNQKWLAGKSTMNGWFSH